MAFNTSGYLNVLVLERLCFGYGAAKDTLDRWRFRLRLGREPIRALQEEATRAQAPALCRARWAEEVGGRPRGHAGGRAHA